MSVAADEEMVVRVPKACLTFGIQVGALALMVLFGAIVKLGGFVPLHRVVRSWPTTRRPWIDADADRLAQVVKAVDRTVAVCHTSGRCLCRSATVVCLLRALGVRAELIIGVFPMPFAAHAWAEVEGHTVSERPGWRHRYIVIERL
jgi:Transglutaminase-like superfamily